MKLKLMVVSLLLLVAGCTSPQYVYYQPPVYYQPAYVNPPPYYVVQPRCYWVQRYIPQYNAYRSVRVCN